MFVLGLRGLKGILLDHERCASCRLVLSYGVAQAGSVSLLVVRPLQGLEIVAGLLQEVAVVGVALGLALILLKAGLLLEEPLVMRVLRAHELRKPLVSLAALAKWAGELDR